MAPILTHEKSGRTVDVSADDAEFYTGHGWVAGTNTEAEAAAEAEAKAQAEAEAEAEAEAKATAEAEANKGSDDSGTDAGDSGTAPRKAPRRSAEAKD